MELSDSRFLVAGATGFLGGSIARGLAGRGARVAVAGRSQKALAEISTELDCPAIILDYGNPASAPGAVASAVAELGGGLDGVVIATGAVAFGQADELGDDVTTELMRTNVTGPMSLINSALDELSPDGAVVGITAVVAEFPTAGMAAYSASKAALAAYLSALRRERRRKLATVLEVSPGHMDTGFADHALAGSPPPLPAGEDPAELVEAILEALEANRREVRYDLKARTLNVK